MKEMYNNMGTQPGVPRPPVNAANAPPNPFGNAFYGAGSGLIRGGLGAYGEKILGSSSEYVQSNVSGIYCYDLRRHSCLSSECFHVGIIKFVLNLLLFVYPYDGLECT